MGDSEESNRKIRSGEKCCCEDLPNSMRKAVNLKTNHLEPVSIHKQFLICKSLLWKRHIDSLCRDIRLRRCISRQPATSDCADSRGHDTPIVKGRNHHKALCQDNYPMSQAGSVAADRSWPTSLSAQSNLSGGPTTFIPWSENALSNSSGVGTFGSFAASRMKVSNVPAGLTSVISEPGWLLM